MSRTKGVRIQPVLPIKVYDQLMQAVSDSGTSISYIVTHLIQTQTPKLREEPPTKPAAQEQQPKPQNNLTTEEKVELSWLEKQPFQNLDGSEIDRLNFLTMKKRQSQQT